VRDPPRALLLKKQKEIMATPGFDKNELRPFGSLEKKKKKRTKKSADTVDAMDIDGGDPDDEAETTEDPASMAKFVEEGVESEGEEDYAERERELTKALGDAAAVKHRGLTANRTIVVECLKLVQKWISSTPSGSIPIHGRITTIYNEDARGDTRDHQFARRIRFLMDQIHAQLASDILHPKGTPIQRAMWGAAARPPYPLDKNSTYRKPSTLLEYEKLFMDHLSVKMMGTVTMKDSPGVILLVGQWYIEGVMFGMVLLLEEAAAARPAEKKKRTQGEEEEEKEPMDIEESPYTFRAIRDFRNVPDEGVDNNQPVFKEGAATYWYISYTFVDTALAEAAGEVLLADHEL
jgi:hypothetical protein